MRNAAHEITDRREEIVPHELIKTHKYAKGGKMYVIIDVIPQGIFVNNMRLPLTPAITIYNFMDQVKLIVGAPLPHVDWERDRIQSGHNDEQ
jgi:hypothetical protein